MKETDTLTTIAPVTTEEVVEAPVLNVQIVPVTAVINMSTSWCGSSSDEERAAAHVARHLSVFEDPDYPDDYVDFTLPIDTAIERLESEQLVTNIREWSGCGGSREVVANIPTLLNAVKDAQAQGAQQVQFIAGW